MLLLEGPRIDELLRTPTNPQEGGRERESVSLHKK